MSGEVLARTEILRGGDRGEAEGDCTYSPFLILGEYLLRRTYFGVFVELYFVSELSSLFAEHGSDSK